MKRKHGSKAPNERAVEIKVFWNDNLDASIQLESGDKTRFVIGEAPDCDYPVSPDRLGQSAFTLVSSDPRGRVVARIPEQAAARSVDPSGRRERLERGSVPLDLVGTVDVTLGVLRFEIGLVKVEESFARIMRPEKRWTAFALGSLALHAAFFCVVWLMPPEIEDPMRRIDSNRIARFMFTPPGVTENNVPSMDLRMSRSVSTAQMARSSGILSFLPAESPPATTNDPETALGALDGSRTDGNLGYGGLSIRGTGRGGGGTGGGSIGLGQLNTIGHGGGGGSGAGYGRGANHYGIRGPGQAPFAFLNNPAKVAQPGFNTERYAPLEDNPFLRVSSSPLSTFSIDVDTASYANIRRFLRESTPPPKDAVRIEEIVNYFSYDYRPPAKDAPFSVQVETAECPWNRGHRLARIGLRGLEIRDGERAPANLVFLIDVSGSMQAGNKLSLLKRAMKMLVRTLDERDRVAIAVYAGASGLVLDSTPASDRQAIIDAIDRLSAGGSTNGGAGIRLAYDTARRHFDKRGINRVILATDGDFNVGVTGIGELVRLIEQKAEIGVFLSVLGFGMGNYNDAGLEQLADKGNGNYAYIDTEKEARKVLVEEINGTLQTIAKDVKIQVEFNPERVASYRLIGYENRMLEARDFNDDKKDAGEIGAGHTVTALYELTPVGPTTAMREVDPLKYQTSSLTEAAGSGELFTLKLRYKKPDGKKSELLTYTVNDDPADIAKASADFKFAAAAAGFGMLLRDSPHKGDADFDTVLELARQGRGPDRHGHRKEFLEVVEQARRIIKVSTASRIACDADPQGPPENSAACLLEENQS